MLMRGCCGGWLRGEKRRWQSRHQPLPDSYVLKVPRGSSIGGVVQDESGQPVAGAGIQVSFYGTGDCLQPRVPARTARPSQRWIIVGHDRQRGPLDFRKLFHQRRLQVSPLTIPIFQRRNFQNDDDARSRLPMPVRP